ncbi:MAG: A/G-specific adenine glycosylase [Anaerolineales bacterium]|jgi:A/G-specific adenine glycosylase
MNLAAFPSSAALARRLLNWYDRNARDLPWRHSHDPYAIWLSEVLLQQTRVETARPYYRRLLKQFPSVRMLARAPLQQVLKSWEGLGYYARARNLHRAARRLAETPDRNWPKTALAWRRLPGVGAYTASAIASIAYGECTPALDGNARRVLARLLDYRGDVRSARGERHLARVAASLVPCGRAGDFNQALMDLGAMVCTARQPYCRGCPLRGRCLAFRRGVQEDRPRRKRAAPRPHYQDCAAIVRRGGRYLIRQRPGEGLLAQLWEFPGGRPERGETLAACLQRRLWQDLEIRIRAGEQVLRLEHAYSHFRVTRYVFECRASSRPARARSPSLRWVGSAQFKDFPMGKTDRQIADWIRKPRASRRRERLLA